MTAIFTTFLTKSVRANETCSFFPINRIEFRKRNFQMLCSTKATKLFAEYFIVFCFVFYGFHTAVFFNSSNKIAS